MPPRGVSISMSDRARRDRSHDDYIGDRYGVVSEGGREALRLLARTEAVILDPVYSSKAMAGLIDHIRKGRIGMGETVVFLHTAARPRCSPTRPTSASADRHRGRPGEPEGCVPARPSELHDSCGSGIEIAPRRCGSIPARLSMASASDLGRRGIEHQVVPDRSSTASAGDLGRRAMEQSRFDGGALLDGERRRGRGRRAFGIRVRCRSALVTASRPTSGDARALSITLPCRRPPRRRAPTTSAARIDRR